MAMPPPSSETMELQPYIFFYGRCQEALDFYKSALGGSYEVMLVKDGPMAAQMPANFQDKVMHASFTSAGVKFLASDGREAKAVDPDAGNVSVGLRVSDGAEAERVFKALSAGGDVKMPWDDAFWGGKFGMFVDRFGLEWMMTSP